MKEKSSILKFKNDKLFRAEVLLYFSLAINLIYALLQGINGIAARSIWSGTLAFYYLTLSVIRFSLLIGRGKMTLLKKWKRYVACGAVMLLLVFALFGIHCITLYMGHTIVYPGYMIYAIAAYTFYSAIAAVRNIVVYRAYHDPVLSASKALSLATAAISMYSLQSALISAFGNSEEFRIIMGNCLGAAVFLLILSMSVYMLIRGLLEIRGKK